MISFLAQTQSPGQSPAAPAFEIEDIEGPVELPPWPEPWMVWLAWGIVAGLALLALFLLARRLGLFQQAIETISPRSRAMSALETLRQSTEELTPYQFSVRVDDVIREFIVQTYDIPFRNQTSHEFLQAMHQSRKIEGERRSLLRDFVLATDEFKFARRTGTSADNEELLSKAEKFVRGVGEPVVTPKSQPEVV